MTARDLLARTRVGGPLPAFTEPRTVGGWRPTPEDDIHPWRVVGVGDAWRVVGADGVAFFHHPSIRRVHAEARATRVLFPSGRAFEGRNLEDLATAAQRLAGYNFELWTEKGECQPYHAYAGQPGGARLRVYDIRECRETTLFLPRLATDLSITILLDWVQFCTPQRVEIDP